MKMSCGHFKKVCTCGTVVLQCRCMDKNKTIVTVVCSKCQEKKNKRIFSFAAIMSAFTMRHFGGTTIEEEDDLVRFLAGDSNDPRQEAKAALIRQWPELDIGETATRNTIDELARLAQNAENSNDEMRAMLINGWLRRTGARLGRDSRAFYQLEGS